MRHAVYAGSFDPVTNGHLWMIREGAGLFDKLTVAIGINPDKRYRFTLEERLAMLNRSVAGIANVTVASFENQFLVHYAKRIGAGFILRGIRNEQDYGYERGMRYVNSAFDGSIGSVFLMPPREYAEVSSSFVKGLVGPEGWQAVLRPYVPPSVFDRFVTADAAVRLRRVQDAVRPMMHGRPYHNVAHIEACLAALQRHRALAEDADAIELAVWLHDAVYDPTRSDNETQSAAFAGTLLAGLGYPLQTVATVRELILATKHDMKPATPDGQLIADLDLLILAEERAEFDAYEDAIRREYQHMTDADFARGRASVLGRFLQRPSIFYRLIEYEPAARANLRQAIVRWRVQ